LMAVADELCGGRLVLSHEGGYSPVYVPFCGLAVMEELSGVKTAVDDPMAASAAAVGGQDLQPHQDAVVRRAERLPSPREPRTPRRRGAAIRAASYSTMA